MHLIIGHYGYLVWIDGGLVADWWQTAVHLSMRQCAVVWRMQIYLLLDCSPRVTNCTHWK